MATGEGGRVRRYAPVALPLAVAVLGSGVLVARTSQAAFTATAEAPGNSWSAARIELTADVAGTAVFSAGDVVPGGSGERCFQVAFSGTGARIGPVRLYADGFADTRGMADHLLLIVETAPPRPSGAPAGCASFSGGTTAWAGTLRELSTHSSYAQGVAPWQPGPTGGAREYRVSWSYSPAAPDSTQGGVAGAGLVWRTETL
ncbi:hypothetical protein [Motilibacter aurantiacus]|uniref:hypothetical protein n=1 Tax=Motilibacter aurantiacus TaxID=2714955 RepID=UPI00140E6D03|nr:hypothetical protein [Motilibacter aurantiacus]NHC46835.1 hypothetical protein [Motilibacter aurantiacus]